MEKNMESSLYDELMVKTLGNAHIKDGTVYYDDAYESSLKESLKKYGLLERYKGELGRNSKGVKMCSIASSSRFCFLASKTIMREIDEHEKVDVRNGCCNPHFDGYSKRNNTFYEFKCHEFCERDGNISHTKITSMDYIPLLKDIFNVDCSDPSKLRFSDLRISMSGDLMINKTNFDFKQFLCHIIGLMSIATKTNKPTLHYVWITPYQPGNRELDDFVSFMDNQIDEIFLKTSELEVSNGKEKGKLKEFINFSCDIIPAVDIDDFVLEGIK